MGTYSPYSEEERATPWLVVTHVPLGKLGDKWPFGSSEVMVYLGKRESQLSFFEGSMLVEGISPNLKYHEVMWRGSVYRVKSSTFSRMKRIPARSKTQAAKTEKYDKKSEP